MSYAVAHDLRQPLLAALITMDGMGSADDPRIAQGHEVVRASLVEALDRIRALLELAGLEQRPVASEPIALREQVERAFERVGSLHPATAMHRDVHGAATVCGDAVLVGMVLGNLIENAVLHGAIDGLACVRVDIAEGPGGCEVRVEDRGAGVDPAVGHRLFDVAAKSARTGGSGLGLAIARRAARHLGGDLVWEPVDPHGARFRFMVPLHATGQRSGADGTSYAETTGRTSRPAR